MKKSFVYLLFVCFLLCGCIDRANKLTTQQLPEFVKSIELQIVESSGKTQNRMRKYILPEEEICGFLERMGELDVRKRLSPSGSKGTYVIEITYFDGAIEFIGTSTISYFSDSKTVEDGWYYVPEEQMYDLFMDYIDPLALVVDYMKD